jgi:hypothetical protein
MALKTKSPKMTLAELEQTAEFKKLTPPQMMFVQTLVQSFLDCGVFDRRLATQAAYAVDGENARTWGAHLVRNPKIAAVLQVFHNFGKSKRGILLDDLRADIKAAKPGSAARAKLREIEAKLLGVKPKKQKRRKSRD